MSAPDDHIETPRRKDAFAPKVHMMEDGSLSYRRGERCALLIVDGLTEAQAWRLLDGVNDKGSLRYRHKCLRHPLTKLRIENLMTEKALLEQDTLYGEPQWMANQLWRQAVATNDTALMEKAAKLRFEIAKQIAPPSAGNGKMPGAPPTRGPGAPIAESAQSNRSIQQLKERFAVMGIRGATIQEAEDDDAP